MKLKKEEAVLVLVDFQERLMPAMKMNEELEQTVSKLIKGCRVLGTPVLVTQQYTKGLGETTTLLKEALTVGLEPNVEIDTFNPIEKTSFSCMGEETFVEELNRIGRKSIILAGIEAHVCVQQTALDMLEAGYKVFLVNDGISSRSNTDKKYASRRMCEAGAIGTTCEAVLFELVRGAKEPGFKQISALVK